MAVTLTVLEQEFLARSSATITAIDPSKVKNKTIEDDSSKQYKANKNRFKIGRPDTRLECTKDLEDFMLFIRTGIKGKKGDDYYFKRRNIKDNGYPISPENKEHIIKYNKRFLKKYYITTTNFYSAGRISEFAKSDGREDPEEDLEDDTKRDLRGLYFRDVCMFTIFNKEKRKTELYIRLTKNKKEATIYSTKT
ncbi:hypothetical protein EJ08DRAFT_679030 [Tothia fuscella]|uniref:Uncharacterized protein n=1 Tax=Tothia fuscella TaxID=1048955 RepID=A0A9P4TZC0_9PEZI|nr:hypothetical protein EJ08DRAFT_679030 [Tothia fuscella]